MTLDLGMPAPRPALQEHRRRLLTRRIQFFVAATITYNVLEAAIALAEGSRVSSTALIGFGLDSVIEVSSAAAVAWQFAGRDPQAREKVALRVIAFSFFGLAAFVTVDSVRSLFGFGEAQHSTVGITLAAVSLAVMPVLSWAQRRAGRELGSLSAVADSKQTLLCTYLSAVLLVGLLLNSVFGWAWADPFAALVIAAIAVREGIEAWKGDTCCVTTIPRSTGTGACHCSAESSRDLQPASRGLDQGTHVGWVPSSCGLPTEEQSIRVAALDALFRESVLRVTRISETTLHLVVAPDASEGARDLAAQETNCCSPFYFQFSTDGPALVMQIHVPESRSAVLDALTARASALANGAETRSGRTHANAVRRTRAPRHSGELHQPDQREHVDDQQSLLQPAVRRR